MDVDRMRPAAAAVLELPYLRGVELHRGVNARGIVEAAVHLPRTLAAVELEGPRAHRLIAIENRKAGFKHCRHRAGVSHGIGNVKAHQREGMRGIDAVRPAAFRLDHGVVEEDVRVRARSVEREVDDELHALARRYAELVSFDRRLEQAAITADDLERPARAERNLVETRV